VQIKTGITDGRYTQVASGDLKAGDTVVVGNVTAKADARGSPGSRRDRAARAAARGASDPRSAMAAGDVIRIDDLVKVYQMGEVEVRALDGVSLSTRRVSSSP
jgi:hypothetical protein